MLPHVLINILIVWFYTVFFNLHEFQYLLILFPLWSIVDLVLWLLLHHVEKVYHIDKLLYLFHFFFIQKPLFEICRVWLVLHLHFLAGRLAWFHRGLRLWSGFLRTRQLPIFSLVYCSKCIKLWLEILFLFHGRRFSLF